MRHLFHVFGLILGMTAFAFAQNARADDIAITNAWARATAPGQDSGFIQFTIKSAKAAKLVAISTPAAGNVEIHSMVRENGRMKMRPVESLDLPAGQEVDLGRGGSHVMLENLKNPLAAGSRVPFSVTVELAGKHRLTVKAEAEVRPQGLTGDMHNMDDMKGMKGMGGM